ncbi:MAG: glycosyltransferase family 2 protein [Blastocatellia bacterium]
MWVVCDQQTLATNILVCFTMKFSIIIPTYNRADELRETLASLARLESADDWEVIVADNNSTDDTRAVVARLAPTFPVALRYLFESEQGRSAALNTGIRAARGQIIVTTDDDVRVESNWLDAIGHAFATLGGDYVAGKVLPVWGRPRPAWLPDRSGRHWAVIALLDYGDEPCELGARAPLGVNMAFRRHCFERAGLWDNRLGRKAGTLLGQEVREWRLRAAAAGLRGFYSSDVIVRHVIPEDRLTKRYFRRWFYWHGISRAMLYQQARVNMEAPEETTLDYSIVPHVAGVPRYMYRSALRMVADLVKAAARRDPIPAFENELWLWFFAGIVQQRWRDRKKGTAFSRPISGAVGTQR